MFSSLTVCGSSAPFAPIPLLAVAIKAGFPSPAESFIEKSLDFNTLIVQNQASTYVLRVSGNSMVNAGIFSGSLVVVDRSLTPQNESIVVAEIDGEFTLKRLLRTTLGFLLHAENPEYPDITGGEVSNVTIWGVVTWVLHQP
jgi:DNA polymerase V